MRLFRRGTFHPHQAPSNLIVVSLVALVVLASGYFLHRAGASGFFAASDPESGTLSGNASLVSDASAVGGKAVKFNAPPAPPGGGGGGGTGGGGSGGGGGGATTTCPLPAYPSASCTGIPAGTVLSAYTGPDTITTANTVIDSKTITTCLVINAPGVIIKNSRIAAAGCAPDVVYNQAASKYHGGYSGTGLVIEDSEISCLSDVNNLATPTNGTAIGDDNVTALRNDIFGCENGFDMDLNADIEDNYVHDLFQSADAHTDGLQAYDGSGEKIIHNTFEGDTWNTGVFGSKGCVNLGYCAGTSAINWNGNPGSGVTTNGLTVKDNLFSGGAYAVYCPGPPSVNVTIQDNHFSYKFRNPSSTTVYSPSSPYNLHAPPWKPDAGNVGVGAYGPWTQCGDEAVVTGNVIQETGLPVPPE